MGAARRAISFRLVLGACTLAAYSVGHDAAAGADAGGAVLGLTLTSLPANLWAVPIVSLVTVPLILLAVIGGVFPR